MKSFKSTVTSVLRFVYISSLYMLIVGTPKEFTIWHRLAYSIFTGIYTFFIIQVCSYFAFSLQGEYLTFLFSKGNLFFCLVLVPIFTIISYITAPKHS